MKRSFWRINLLIAAIFALLTIGAWAMGNKPSAEPAWPRQVAGMSFSPLRAGNDPGENLFPSHNEIDSDLGLLAGKVRSIRTYGLGGAQADIPAMARKHQIKVTLGAWLTSNLEENEREIEKLIAITRTNPNVTRVVVGNEALLRGELSAEQLAAYLDRVRGSVSVPASTGEPWNVWLANPELAGHADFIAAHFLPYWEGIALEEAVAQVVANVRLLEAAFPGKPVLLAEVGWPSNGRTLRSAVASEANEAIFLRRFLARAEQEQFDYFLMEAFDQPWKTDTEGAVGAYWGVYNLDRQQKFEFTEPIVPIPHWRLLAAVSVAMGLVGLTMLLIDGRALGRRGRIFLAAVAYGVAAVVVWVAYDYGQQYLTPFTVAVGVALLLGFCGICLVLFTEAHELAEARWVTRRRRPFPMPEGGGALAGNRLPMVSIHVPAYNEPPAMMLETLNALARLDYPDFEVLVIDNNTKDPQVWRPVQEHCRRLGPRFRFYHVDPLQGFKAGALNYALERTGPAAEVVAVIDCDYQVSPRWLRDLVPHFRRPEIGIVQAPQDYRDGEENTFKAMCYAEYKGFFHIGMVTRNDRNAIIEHGTMTMVRTSVLKQVGGWAEWCITEDAELGLRVFMGGHEAIYTEQSYGRGVMPDTFLDYKKQRYRWAYGSVQIMRRHLRQLIGLGGTRLTRGQRYHFIAGWLPWMADGLNLFYTLAALAWSALIIIDPQHTDPPLALFTLPPLAFFLFKVGKLVFLYRSRVGATRLQTLAAALAGLALTHTIAKAVVAGFWTSDKPFFRTPKCENHPALVRALLSALEESMLAFALIASATGVILVQGREFPGTTLWGFALCVQSLPYLAALLMALTNASAGDALKGQLPVPPLSPG
jgi:exo-beta-1,3-glucanase (GH17 family)/cellulose synthase/poly-beta-1,6-N-acetylglucosamine synthase-like glycosyltransferase